MALPEGTASKASSWFSAAKLRAARREGDRRLTWNLGDVALAHLARLLGEDDTANDMRAARERWVLGRLPPETKRLVERGDLKAAPKGFVSRLLTLCEEAPVADVAELRVVFDQPSYRLRQVGEKTVAFLRRLLELWS